MLLGDGGVAGPESHAHAPYSADSLATADYQGVDNGAGGGAQGVLGGDSGAGERVSVGGGGNDSLPILHRVEGAE